MFTDKINSEKTQKIIGITVTVLLVGLIGWYVMRDISPVNPTGELDKVGGGSIEALVESGDAEIKEIPTGLDLDVDTVARPKLGRAITFPDRFSSEAIEILVNNIATLTTQLKEDPNSFQAWSDLAIQYKIIDDFEGAAEIWGFLIISTEDNVNTRINLGNLYHYQLREYEKSEAVFKEIIDIDSSVSGAYTGLHELYRYSYKTDTAQAIDILKEGVVAVPDDIDIRMLLASYYTKIDMKDEALLVYEEVLVMANTAGNTNLVTIIESAIQNLK